MGKGTSTVGTTVFDASTNKAWTNTESTGASAFDTSTVGTSDTVTATGTVTYALFTGTGCAAANQVTTLNGNTWPDTVTLDSAGNAPNSQATGTLAQGGYSFQATYSGDGNYTGNTSPCEPFTVVPTVEVPLPTVNGSHGLVFPV